MQDNEQLNKDLKNVLLQLWQASSKTTEGGRKYFQLTVQEKPFINRPDDGAGGLSSYRIHSLACTIAVQDNDNHRQEGVISRVFRTKRPEISPNISYYLTREYPHRDFALSCGMLASLCLPHFKTVDHSGCPDGVIELVTTYDNKLMQIFDLYIALQVRNSVVSSFFS